jgi:hypothetical protein
MTRTPVGQGLQRATVWPVGLGPRQLTWIPPTAAISDISRRSSTRHLRTRDLDIPWHSHHGGARMEKAG